MRSGLLISVFLLGATALAPPSKAQEEEVPQKPIVRVETSKPFETREGKLVLSNGKEYYGLIYTTPGKRLKIYRRNDEKILEIPLSHVERIVAEPEVERNEPEWRWKEYASDEKVYTGRHYPWRKVVTTITTTDGKEITGDISALIYVLESGQKSPTRFMLQKRQKGEIGETLEKLVYVKQIDLTGQKKAEMEPAAIAESSGPSGEKATEVDKSEADVEN